MIRFAIPIRTFTPKSPANTKLSSSFTHAVVLKPAKKGWLRRMSGADRRRKKSSELAL
jgi:hypothetical protein